MKPSVSRSGSPSEDESESEPESESELTLGDFWSSSSSSLGESFCGCDSVSSGESSSLLAMGKRWKEVSVEECVCADKLCQG